MARADLFKIHFLTTLFLFLNLLKVAHNKPQKPFGKGLWAWLKALCQRVIVHCQGKRLLAIIFGAIIFFSILYMPYITHQWIHMSHCNLENIEKNSFSSLPALQAIILKKCLFCKKKSKSLCKMSSMIMQVSYSYCNIRHPDIHQDIFHWHGYKVHCFCNDYYNVLCNPVQSNWIHILNSIKQYIYINIPMNYPLRNTIINFFINYL